MVGDPSSLQTQLRVAGVRQAVTEAGQRPPTPVAAGRTIDDGFRAARALLLAAERPTALICTHERLAIGATLVATELRMEIPAQLSLVSLEDGERLTSTLVPALSTVHRPDRAMGEQAVTLLLEQLAGGPQMRELLFACPLRERDSVAAVWQP